MFGMGAASRNVCLTPAEQTQLNQQLGSPITQQSTSQALSAAGSQLPKAQVADFREGLQP